ncbi:hypothetical protein TH30_01160 [Thalassospira profundimaris]|uniref:Uncharacterized protein n=1 Tax=Thalassospira profundimaris TaxID=502049 RepID=A0A367X7A0_9PROT|nr:hypothetical protein TH30_01160 [Thalassospira profundimaris]
MGNRCDADAAPATVSGWVIQMDARSFISHRETGKADCFHARSQETSRRCHQSKTGGDAIGPRWEAMARNRQ